MLFLSILFAAAPFVAASIRAFSGNDLRMLWMAIASSVGAAGVMALGKARSQELNSVGMLSVLALVIATLLAGSVAYWLGARAPFGIWAVAFVLSLFSTASCVLYARSRRQPVGDPLSVGRVG
jgi:O-antigen/teichoic acid export membrane protein